MLAPAFLVSGAALVVSIFLQAPMALVLALLLVVAAAAIALRLHRLDPGERRRFWRTSRIGLIAGLAGTGAYDLTRWLLVSVGQLDVQPFETFPIFGRLLLGDEAGPAAALIAGSLYHALNGSMFGAAYAILLGRRPWPFGILWAFGLELAMVSIYPGWLDLEAVLAEFVAVSMIGHVAYGAVLGLMCQRWIGGVAGRRTRGGDR